jgi:putative ABC transport system permease protein
MWVRGELSYDGFHEHADEICRVLIQYDHKNVYQKFLPGALPAALKNEIPEIQSAGRLSPIWPLEKNPMKHGDRSFILNGHVADPEFFSMFSFPFIKGNPHTALQEPGSVVITEKTANRLFGSGEAIGRVVQFELWGRWRDVRVTAVLKNFPHNSTIHFDFAIPSSLMKKYRRTWDSWEDICAPAYVRLRDHLTYRSLNKKIENFILGHRPESRFTVHLFPLKKIHLHHYGGGGPITYIYIFSAIGIIILVIAIFNYMNLATARSLNRVKEIGIRKVVGSTRSQLIKQHISESVVFTAAALGVSLILLKFLIPVVNPILGSRLTLVYSKDLIAFIIGLMLVTGVTAGSYPGFYLSKFKPVHMLKGSRTFGPKSSRFRKYLVLAQFTISLCLIIGAATVGKQLKYIKNRDLGFDQDHIVNLEMRGTFFKKWPVIKEQLLLNPDILHVTAAYTSLIQSEKTTAPIDWEGKKGGEVVHMEWHPVDHDYLNTFGMRMAEGRFFSEKFPTDAEAAVILNESAVKALGMTSPLGKRFVCEIGNELRRARIIGVVRDFNFSSLHHEIKPVIFAIAPGYYNELYIKLNPANPDIPGIIDFIETKIREFVPDYPFDYTLLNEDIARLYTGENRAGILVQYGALLAVFIACLGLIGLASYDAEHRTREIGIRKVLGASVAGVMLLVSKDYLKWIVLANMVAWPLAWVGSNQWLQGFAYHPKVHIGIFFAASLIVLFVAAISMGFQVARAALVNPVESLRHE